MVFSLNIVTDNDLTIISKEGFLTSGWRLKRRYLTKIQELVMWRNCLIISSVLALVLTSGHGALAQENAADKEVVQILREPHRYHAVSPEVFERLGWELPDGGAAIKALADAADGGAFDPRKMEGLQSKDLGYSADWHEVRYRVYGLDWDITGLQLTPESPLPDMPTVIFINGGSSNWYEFFVDPLNNPGLGQYLAQRVPVLLVTIPGNYRHGGWTEKDFSQRLPAYLMDRDVSGEELKVRNAAYTNRLVAEGVTKLVEETTTGPVVISGHSTGGELAYILESSEYLRHRTQGRVLNWEGIEHTATQAMRQIRGTIDRNSWPPVTELRARALEPDYTVRYLGPLNPVWDPDKSQLEMAERWMMDLEFRRRANFKQPLQDLERRGGDPRLRGQVTLEVRQALEGNSLGVDPEEVAEDLFAPMESRQTGYRAIIAAMAGDKIAGRLGQETLAKSNKMQVIDELRVLNPDAEVRLLIFDVPMSHYGHIEKPKQLAGGLLAALRWLIQQ